MAWPPSDGVIGPWALRGRYRVGKYAGTRGPVCHVEHRQLFQVPRHRSYGEMWGDIPLLGSRSGMYIIGSSASARGMGETRRCGGKCQSEGAGRARTSTAALPLCVIQLIRRHLEVGASASEMVYI